MSNKFLERNIHVFIVMAAVAVVLIGFSDLFFWLDDLLDKLRFIH